MSEPQTETRDLPLARILVWTGILATTAAFWVVLAVLALTWLRHG